MNSFRIIAIDVQSGDATFVPQFKGVYSLFLSRACLPPHCWKKLRIVSDTDSVSEIFFPKVHQDEDYVYPSLEVSDDEEVYRGSRSKKDEDELWNPGSRIRVSGSRPDRPVRQSVKRPAVEKGLEQAAARRQHIPVSFPVWQPDYVSKLDKVNNETPSYYLLLFPTFLLTLSFLFLKSGIKLFLSQIETCLS